MYNQPHTLAEVAEQRDAVKHAMLTGTGRTLERQVRIYRNMLKANDWTQADFKARLTEQAI